MTSQGGKSRLAEMQIRFQLKQQQEREQRKIEMTGDSIISSGKNKTNNTVTTSTTTTSEKIEKKSLSSSIGPGKVRQMFDERRQRSTGIDKSYPLKPIQQELSNRTTITPTTNYQKQQISSTLKQTNTSKINSSFNSVKEIKATIKTRQNRNSLNENVKIHNIFEQQDSIDNESFPTDIRLSPDKDLLKEISQKIQLSNLGKQTTVNKIKAKNGLVNGEEDNNANIANQTQNNSNLKLKPVITKKAPSVEPSNRSFESNQKIMSTNDNKNEYKTLSDTKRSHTPLSGTKKSPTKSQSKSETKTTPAGKTDTNGLSSCRICHRNFNSDRLEKHEQICEKMVTKKRKKYDAVKHRVAGTDVEKYIKKNTKIGAKSGNTVHKTNIKNNTNTANTTKQSNWRKTHEDFINTIRAAKQMKAHLAKGGKLSDLPPPPPTDHSDYIQCPHCNRKFNQSAAERHIPKCATFLHNKPKPRTPTVAVGSKKRY